MGFNDRGMIVAGRRADLVLISGRKLCEDISALWEGTGIDAVWKQGLKAVQPGRPTIH
jgi:alpha-D-ribose 1-methylphosphonate 5-triphosphate diphosphatase PhnM